MFPNWRIIFIWQKQKSSHRFCTKQVHHFSSWYGFFVFLGVYFENSRWCQHRQIGGSYLFGRSRNPHIAFKCKCNYLHKTSAIVSLFPPAMVASNFGHTHHTYIYKAASSSKWLSRPDAVSISKTLVSLDIAPLLHLNREAGLWWLTGLDGEAAEAGNQINNRACFPSMPFGGI